MARGYIGTVSAVGVVATAAVVLTVAATSPAAVGPLGVTGWFVVLLLAISCWASLVAYFVVKRLTVQRQAHAIGDSWRRGLFVGGYITVLLALSSLKQFNIRDAILLAVLLVLVEFYVVAKA